MVGLTRQHRPNVGHREMDGVLLATDPATLPVKLVVGCLAGLLPALLSRRVRADGSMLGACCLIACASAAIAVHCVLFEDPGLITGFVGLIIGVLISTFASSMRAAVFAASSISLAALVIVGATLFIRMPPSEMRSAIAHIRQCGGVVQQSDNPGTTYRDQWWVTFEYAGINDSQLLGLAPDVQTLPKLWLTLSNCQVSDRGVAGLAGADNLVWLELDGTQVTDEGLPHLSNLHRLERLNLHGTRVSDDGLRSLLHLSSLENVRLDETAVTETGAQQLRKALPKCTITLSDHQGQRLTATPSGGAAPALAAPDQQSPRNKAVNERTGNGLMTSGSEPRRSSS